MSPNLTNDDVAVITRLLRDTIAADPYPLSPRIKRLKAILAKFDPSAAPVERPILPPAPIHKPSTLAQGLNARRLRGGRA
jgi:hypothetical protein